MKSEKKLNEFWDLEQNSNDKYMILWYIKNISLYKFYLKYCPIEKTNNKIYFFMARKSYYGQEVLSGSLPRVLLQDSWGQSIERYAICHSPSLMQYNNSTVRNKESF